MLNDVQVVLGRDCNFALNRNERQPAILLEGTTAMAPRRHGNQRKVQVAMVQEESLGLKVKGLRLNGWTKLVLLVVHLYLARCRLLLGAQHMMVGQDESGRHDKSCPAGTNAAAGPDQDSAHPARRLYPAFQEFNREKVA